MRRHGHKEAPRERTEHSPVATGPRDDHHAGGVRHSRHSKFASKLHAAGNALVRAEHKAAHAVAHAEHAAAHAVASAEHKAAHTLHLDKGRSTEHADSSGRRTDMSGPLRPCQVWVHRGALGDEDAQHDHLTADLHELAGESSHGKLQLPPELRPPPGPAASQHKLEKRGSLKLIDLKFPVGARVDHVHRGKGTVSAVEGGVRYITYDTGEKHRY